MIYQSAVEGSENKAFPISAKFIFYAILFITYKESNGKMPSNKELIHKAETDYSLKTARRYRKI